MQVSHWRQGSKCERLAIVLVQTCCFLPSTMREAVTVSCCYYHGARVWVARASPLGWTVFSDIVSPFSTPFSCFFYQISCYNGRESQPNREIDTKSGVAAVINLTMYFRTGLR